MVDLTLHRQPRDHAAQQPSEDMLTARAAMRYLADQLNQVARNRPLELRHALPSNHIQTRSNAIRLRG